MVRWQTRIEWQGTEQEAQLLADGWEPVGATTVEHVRYDRHEAVKEPIPATILRRRIPEPLRACEGCRYAGVTFQDIVPQLHIRNGQFRECRRYPKIETVDGKGCGEWEVANG